MKSRSPKVPQEPWNLRDNVKSMITYTVSINIYEFLVISLCAPITQLFFQFRPSFVLFSCSDFFNWLVWFFLSTQISEKVTFRF